MSRSRSSRTSLELSQIRKDCHGLGRVRSLIFVWATIRWWWIWQHLKESRRWWCQLNPTRGQRREENSEGIERQIQIFAYAFTFPRSRTGWKQFAADQSTLWSTCSQVQRVDSVVFGSQPALGRSTLQSWMKSASLLKSRFSSRLWSWSSRICSKWDSSDFVCSRSDAPRWTASHCLHHGSGQGRSSFGL